MKGFKAIFIIAALASCASLPASAQEGRSAPLTQIAAATGASCVSSYARCAQRCTTNIAGEPVEACRRKHCDSKMEICRKNGCWQQDARFGGEVTCGLK